MAFDVFRKKCGATTFASAIFHITRGIVPRDLSDFGLGVSKRRRYARNFRRRQTNRPLNLRYSKKRVKISEFKSDEPYRYRIPLLRTVTILITYRTC